MPDRSRLSAFWSLWLTAYDLRLSTPPASSRPAKKLGLWNSGTPASERAPRSGAKSITWHIVGLLALTVLFYALVALASIVALSLPIVAEYYSLQRAKADSFGHRFRFDGACIAFGAALIVSAWPRRVGFRTPGIPVTADAQPRLFAFLRRLAGHASQRMPERVFVNAEMNASVSYRGSRVGLGGERYMVLGLPLLQVLTTRELAAVVAHEFGHYAGGDTRIAAWAYRVREAMVRVVVEVDSRLKWIGWLSRCYARWFIRLTRSLGRRQEYLADAFAARIVGADPVIGALRKVGPASAALSAFVSTEFVPLLRSGRRPPFVGGFAQFLLAPQVRAALRASARSGASGAPSSPYDTHPPTSERIAALRDAPPVPGSDDPTAAIALIDGVEHLEVEVLRRHFRLGAVAEMEEVQWADVGRVVDVPKLLHTRASLPADMWGSATLGDLAALRSRLDIFDLRLSEWFSDDGSEDNKGHARRLLAECALAALVEAGWAGQCCSVAMEPTTPGPSGPGSPGNIIAGGLSLAERSEAQPWLPGRRPRWEIRRVFGVGLVAHRLHREIVPARALGSAADMDPDEWRAMCDVEGVAQLPLMPPRSGSAVDQLDLTQKSTLARALALPDPAVAQERKQRAEAKRRSVQRMGLRQREVAARRRRTLLKHTLIVSAIVAVIGVVFWLATVVQSSRVRHDVDAGARAVETFREAWNRSDRDAIIRLFPSESRARLGAMLTRVLTKRGWAARLPALGPAEVELSSAGGGASFDLLNGILKTRWRRDASGWCLLGLNFPD